MKKQIISGMNYNTKLELDFSDKISLAAKEKKTLNKPFRTPNGPKKFSVYVKNDKGNIVKVNFGDPNMEIKRDDPNRRKNFRARHQCDTNPGPKWKARYWSCHQWRAGAPVKGSELVDAEAEAKKGLWHNIQKKKDRLGKNYKPAKPGDKDYPKQDALKKAQAETEEWDGVTFWEQTELLKIWPDLAKAQEEVDTEESEIEDYKNEYLEMSIGSINSIKTHAENILNALNDEKVKENLTEPFLQGKIAITEDYMVMIHNYVMFASEEEEMSSEAVEKLKNKKFDAEKMQPSTLDKKVLNELEKISKKIAPPEEGHGEKDGESEDKQEYRKRAELFKG